ncbi:calponin homology domain-containing protein DDB_G0272472 isoform X2 [Impatiens glandulifera]|uniref:calponin homology domain-containing protein DDB_G0272472 isoform X2 n=1 Tax=Impatiens glandulifera TaxID=253017 RepID=UPI001FB0BD18|nr:calponin homology domain-containing protein DDB_G0272472 isoform X2 [Impatiens glandulifera]
MGERSRKNKKKRHYEDSSDSYSSSSSSSSSSSEEENELSSKRHKHSSRRHRDEKRHSEGSSRRREKDKRRQRRKKEKEERDRKRRRSRRKEKTKISDLESDGGSESLGGDDSVEPGEIVRDILREFPSVAADLEQLLKMIDDGQAVDISGLAERSLINHLKKLFMSLNLKDKGGYVFLLPPNGCPTLEIVGKDILSEKPLDQQQTNQPTSEPEAAEHKEMESNVAMPTQMEDSAPKRRIGPEMPSAELLAAAAKLTEAEAELREVELDEDSLVFIGPPPPAMVSEAESSNEAERFEEVTRIVGAEVDSPYDVLGVNRKMPTENVKKRYWKLSLMVHPDKCSHPQANQAFIKLNKAFKDLQDPEKRKALDDKIKEKEEQEEFKAELRAMREAAQWRRLQGISMEGDDVLLEDLDAKLPPKRDEWMTTLPPERKPAGVPTQSTTAFHRNGKEARGDTSAWTDTPSDRAQKAKQNYLEAYNEAAALASKEEVVKKTTNMDAELVAEYNKAKRSKSLVEKHKEAAAGGRSSGAKKKNKSMQEKEGKEVAWEGQHPWKPWDREKDLTAGRKSINLDPQKMNEGLTSRFSSSSFQRNFL